MVTDSAKEHPGIQLIQGIRPGIGFALQGGVWTDDDRLEHLCRMGLLAVALLHWVLFILMVTSKEESISDQVPRAFSNLASLLLTNLPSL